MNNPNDLTGKTAVVTGATAGIGLYSLLALARAGAFVIGIGRDAQRNRQALEFARQACPEAQVSFLLADLALQSQVRRLGQDICSALEAHGTPYLDILVNNAGIYSQKLVRTTEGIELTLAVNHLAVFLLTHELLPVLNAAQHGRVITVSSHSHTRARMNPARLNNPPVYIGIWAYALSKLANILFTYELNRRLRGNHLHAYAVDPGLVNTDIGIKQAGALSHLVWRNRAKHGQPPALPAETVLLLSRDGNPENEHVYWYNCQPIHPSPQAQREDLARELWQVSCELCQIEW